MKTISRIAYSNDKKNKTRSILIMMSICLTTMLLVIISTVGNGVIHLQKSQAAGSYGSNYGLFIAADGTQLKEVERRAEISDIGIMCTEGILKGNENGGFVSADETVRKMLAADGTQLKEVERRAEISDIGIMCTEGILKGNENGGFVSADETVRKMLPYNQEYVLKEGTYPEKAQEIAAGRAFFDAVGYHDVKVGDTVTLEYRSGMQSEYAPVEFTVSGILYDRDEYTIEASYVVFGSQDFYNERVAEGDRQYNIYFTLSDSANVSMNNVAPVIKEMASYVVFGSQDFYNERVAEGDRQYNIYFTLSDSANVSMNNVAPVIKEIADSCGIDQKNVIINDLYLQWVLQPSYEMIVVCGTLILGIVLFSVVVIYNIFQVGIAQKVQEYGKIKALGATRKQMKQLIFREGILLAVPSIPLGLLFGFLIAKVSFNWLVEQGNLVSSGIKNHQVPLFSLTIMLICIFVSFLTVVLALRKPMKIVSRISPIEATRYLDGSKTQKQGRRKGRKDVTVFSMAMANVTGNPKRTIATISPIEATRYLDGSKTQKQGRRKGRKDVTVFSMAMANVTGNPKRTIATILTMGLSCVLFVIISNYVGNIDTEQDVTVFSMAMANVTGNPKRTIATILTMGLSCVLFVIISNYVGNIDTEHEARIAINHGQFELQLDYSQNYDEAYSENNLDTILQNNPLNDSLIKEIKSIPGVTDVLTREIVSADLNGTKFPVAIVNQEDFEMMRGDGDIGSMDYAQAVKNGDVFFGWSMWMEADGYSAGAPITFNFDNGSGTYTYHGKIAGSFVSADTYLVIPEEVYRSVNPKGTSYGYLWVDCAKKDVASVEQSLNDLLSDTSHIKLNTYHAELQTAEYASRMMKLGCYLFMAIVGLIGFMNLANTMIINITTKKQEYGVLQAVGMTNKQLNLSLQIQGLIFTVGTICVALAAGLPLGYALFSYAKHNGIFGMNVYHVPLIPILVMILLVGILQIVLSCVLSSNLKKETLVERIRYQG